MAAPRARIIIGNLEPILVLGLSEVLTEEGIDVLGHENDAGRLVTESVRLRPDAVVLDLNDGDAAGVALRVRRAAPSTKVVLWSRDETVMEVLDPFSDVVRFVAAGTPHGLSSELTRTRPRVEE